jgi:hypothetical protein
MEEKRTVSDVVEWILHNMDKIEDIVIVAEVVGGLETAVESNTKDFYKQLGMLEHAKNVLMYGEDIGEEIS